MQGPFQDGIRPWMRRTKAKVAAATTVLAAGEMMLDELGNLYTGDGVAQVRNLPRHLRAGDFMTNILDFGVKADGVTDDTTALTAAFASASATGKPLWFPNRSIRITSTISRNFSGVVAIGERGARIFSDVVDELLRMGSGTVGAHFENIIFETTVSSSTESVYGLVESVSGTLRNVLFYRCRFLALNRAINGVKLIADSANTTLMHENILARECYFECGRMGFEMQDHSSDKTVVRTRNSGAIDCTFSNGGKLSQGIDLSFSGRMAGCISRNNIFIGSILIAAEFAQDHQQPICEGNTFIDLAAGCYAMSFTNSVNSTKNVNAVISRNRSLGRSGRGVRFYQLEDAKVSFNTLIFAGDGIDVRNCRRCRFKNDTYDSTGSYVMFVQDAGVNKDCTWEDCEFHGESSTTAFAVVRFWGPSCTWNILRRCWLFRGTSGAMLDQGSSATNNMMDECFVNSVYSPLRTLTLTDADRTLTNQEMDTRLLTLSGTLTVARTITLPREPMRRLAVQNNTGQALTIAVTGGSSTSSIAAGQAKTVMVADNVVAVV